MRNRIAIVLLCIIIVSFSVSCAGREYTGVFRANEDEYLAVLEKNRTRDQAVVIVSALKDQFGDDWCEIEINSSSMVENGNKSRIRIHNRDIYVDISSTLKELEKYIGTAASDISKEQKWGSYIDNWNTIESISGQRYYRVK